MLGIAMLVSCQSQAQLYNLERVNMDEGAKVLIDPYLQIISINGKSYTPPFNPFHKPIPLVFERGLYTFRLRYNAKWAIFKTLTDFIDLECTFEKGTYYQVYYQFKDTDQIVIDYMKIEARDDEIGLFR